jgi:hypothetical protein
LTEVELLFKVEAFVDDVLPADTPEEDFDAAVDGVVDALRFLLQEGA